MTRDEGIVLVEFVALGRFNVASEFPFIHAWLKQSLHIPVLWVRFALDPAVRFGSRESGIGLKTADMEALLKLLRNFPARRALFNFQPSESLWRKFRSEHPQADGRFFSARIAARGEIDSKRPRPLRQDGQALARWLGLKTKEAKSSSMPKKPDFGFIAGNREARTMQPLAFVQGGQECVYRKSVVGNPAYEGVDLTGSRTEGCAFCVGGASAGADQPRRASTVEDALRQIESFFRTYPLKGARSRPRLRMSGQQLLLEVETLAARMSKLDFPPCDLLFDARIDYLLRLKDRLAEAAKRLKGTGHKVHICLVGLENFSFSELRRMNKGIAPAQSLAAIRILRNLERSYPKEFAFEEHGGLSTIFFTPWTTLDDLALNFSIVGHFRLESLCGKRLTSRVRLYDGLPLTALARHDGLIVDRYDDATFDTARLNFYPDEIKWKFKHPGVSQINRITMRMDANPALESDPLYARVQAWLKTLTAAGASQTQCIVDLVGRALSHRGPVTAEALLEPPAKKPLLDSSNPLMPGIEPAKSLLLKLELQRAGFASVSRLEHLDCESAERLGRQLRSKGSKVIVAPRRQRNAPRKTWDVFFGPRSGDVATAARLTDVQYSSENNPTTSSAKRGLGELFGYPKCCARAFASFRCSSPHLNEWMILLRRCEHPGPIDPLLNPFSGLVIYVPCSVRCPTSIRRSREILKLSSRVSHYPVKSSLKHPFLFLLDRIGEHIELIPKGAVGRSFDFISGAIQGHDPELLALAGGGRITIAEGIIVVHRDGVRVASFIMRAAVWWHQQAFDSAFWRECSAEILERLPETARPSKTVKPAPKSPAKSPAKPPPQPPAKSPAKPPPRPPAQSPVKPPPQAVSPSIGLAERVRTRLSQAGSPVELADFIVTSIEPSQGRYVIATLARRSPLHDGGDALIVNIEPLQGAARYYKAVGDLAFGYSSKTPLRTRAQAVALAALMTRLGKPGT